MSKKYRKYTVEEVRGWLNGWSLSDDERFPFPNNVNPTDLAFLAVELLKRVEGQEENSGRAKKPSPYQSDRFGVIGKEPPFAYADACAGAARLIRHAQVQILRERSNDNRYQEITRRDAINMEMWSAFKKRVEDLNDKRTMLYWSREKNKDLAEAIHAMRVRKHESGFDPCFPISRSAIFKLAGIEGGETTKRMKAHLRWRVEKMSPDSSPEDLEKYAAARDSEFKETGIFRSDFEWFIEDWQEIRELICDLRAEAETKFKRVPEVIGDIREEIAKKFKKTP